MAEKSNLGEQLGLWPSGRDVPTEQGGLARPRRPLDVAAQRPARRTGAPTDLLELWGIDDVANYLGVPKQTIYSWRQTGYGPKAIRVGKHLRWRAAVVIEWTLAQERES